MQRDVQRVASEMGDPPNAVVIDNGAWRLKAGVAGGEEPTFAIMNKGSRRLRSLGGGCHTGSFGKDGLVTDWAAMEALWEQTFYCMNADSRPALWGESADRSLSHHVLLTGPLLRRPALHLTSSRS